MPPIPGYLVGIKTPSPRAAGSFRVPKPKPESFFYPSAGPGALSMPKPTKKPRPTL